jgi:hypothetical protein
MQKSNDPGKPGQAKVLHVIVRAMEEAVVGRH